jgi:hypothetical protein
LKNVAQFALIAAVAPAPEDGSVDAEALAVALAVADAVADVLAEAVGVADADVDAVADVLAVAELVELLEQAVTAAANAKPSTGTSRTRRDV